MQSSNRSETTNGAHLFPFEEQEPFLGTAHTYYGYISGVGAGKTYGGILRTAWNVMKWNPGEMGAIVAPTTTMIKDVIVPQMRRVGLLDRWEYKSAHSDEPGLHAADGSRILLLSADNRRTIERLAGLNLAWWWLDEATRVPERAYEILTQRLRVGKYQNGFVTTTPMGKDYVYETFVDEAAGETYQHGEADVHEHGLGDRLAILRVPTWANPFTAEGYKEQMERKEGQTYEREILGRFVDYEGLIYPWFDEGNLVESAPDQYDETIYGVDWGFNSPAAIVCLVRNSGTWTVVEDFYERGCTVTDIGRQAHAMQERWGPGVFYCDAAQPENIEELSRDGLNAQQGDKAVLPGIQHVASLSDSIRVVESCQDTRNEFSQYQWQDSDDEDKPLKQNDHLMDALRYALYTHARYGSQRLSRSKHSLGDLA